MKFVFSLLVLCALSPGSCLAASIEIVRCADVSLEIIAFDGEDRRQVGVARITNSGEVAREYALYGVVDLPESLPMMHSHAYTIYTRGSGSSEWQGTFPWGTALAPTARLRVEPDKTALVAVNLGWVYQLGDEKGAEVELELVSNDPLLCSARSGSVRIADLNRYIPEDK